jgi:hypothetical protein
MFNRRSKRDFSPIHVANEAPRALAHGAEEAANRIAHAVEDSKPKLERIVSRTAVRSRSRPDRNDGTALKSELAKTSRDLAHESTDLTRAVSSLNAVIKANRKAAARGRTRLIGGVAIGATLMYHFDGEHGRERRAATARRLRGLVRGK